MSQFDFNGNGDAVVGNAYNKRQRKTNQDPLAEGKYSKGIEVYVGNAMNCEFLRYFPTYKRAATWLSAKGYDVTENHIKRCLDGQEYNEEGLMFFLCSDRL